MVVEQRVAVRSGVAVAGTAVGAGVAVFVAVLDGVMVEMTDDAARVATGGVPVCVGGIDVGDSAALVGTDMGIGVDGSPPERNSAPPPMTMAAMMLAMVRSRLRFVFMCCSCTTVGSGKEDGHKSKNDIEDQEND